MRGSAGAANDREPIAQNDHDLTEVVMQRTGWGLGYV